jgi:hypothetical protein
MSRLTGLQGRSKRDCVNEVLWYVFLLVSLASFSVCGWMLFYPYDPIRIDEIKLGYSTTDAVGKTSYHEFAGRAAINQGDEICFQFVGEKFMPVPVKAMIELVDGQTIFMIAYESNNPPGCKFSWRCFDIPYSVRPHAYQIRWSGVYPVNPLRKISETKLSPYFDVRKTELFKMGVKGDTGKSGPQGIQGKSGPQGKSSKGYSIFGDVNVKK